MTDARDLLGVGLYTVSEAAAYTGIRPSDIHRWIFGYETGSAEHRRKISGLWRPKLADYFDQKALSFQDLIEVRFVNAFRQYGVSLQAIRAASKHASEYFNQDYPFTCERFRTDGRTIFAEALNETGDEKLLDLAKKQYVFAQVVKPSLYQGIEYTATGAANCWFPLPRSRAVVLDPNRQFGKPILTDSGINTAAILDAYRAEGDNSKRVAAIYEIPVAAVDAAIKFELREAA